MSDHQHEFEPNKKTLEKILQLPCPSCRSELTYSAEKKMLECKHCGFTQDYERARDQIRERPLSEAAAALRKSKPADTQKKVTQCDGCGSQLMVAADDVAVRCGFCGSEKVNTKAFDKNVIQPQGIIPFKISRQEAFGKFKDWIGAGWFRPNDLKNIADLKDMHGVYLPFWTFDAQTYTEWSGEAGHYYYVEVERNGKTERERRTRWEWRSGYFNRFFDDVLILATKGATVNIVENIYPYQLKETTNYDPTLMVGWEARIYDVEVDEGYDLAEKKMKDEIRDQAKRALGGDTQRGLTTDTEFYEQTFKHVILPIWICAYNYNGKVYQFAINGQTGKVEGQKPLSWTKIILFILVLAAIITTIVVLVNANQ